LDQKLKLMDHWIEGLRARQAELSKYGALPEVDIESEIRKLEEEKKTIQLEFSGEAAPMADGPRIELETLLREVDETDLKDSSFDGRWAIYGNWGARWRLLVDRVGQAVVDRERAF